MDVQESSVVFSKDKIYGASFDNKLLLLLAFLGINRTYSNKVVCSLDYMIRKIGYIPDAHENQINDKIISLLHGLIKDQYISVGVDIDKVKPKDIFEIWISWEKNLFDVNTDYVLLTESEFDKITQSKSCNIGKDTLLRVFLVIKSYININGEHQVGYPAVRTIQNKCHITSDKCVVNAIRQLQEIGILYVYCAGSYRDENGKRQNANSFYAIDKDQLQADYCKKISTDLIKKHRGISVNRFDTVTKPTMKKDKPDQKTEEKPTAIKPVEQKNESYDGPELYRPVEKMPWEKILDETDHIKTVKGPKFTVKVDKPKERDYDAEFLALLEEEEKNESEVKIKQHNPTNEEISHYEPEQEKPDPDEDKTDIGMTNDEMDDYFSHFRNAAGI